MSDAHQDHSDAPHEGPIKTPKQLIVAVALAFLVPIAIIVLLVSYVGADKKTGAGSDVDSAQSVAERIQPVGRVEVKDVSDASALKTGEQVVTAVCASCHATGALGAPKIGDAEAWGPRIKTGYEALLHSALAGKNAMPPQGGGDFSDLEIGRAVVFMADKAGAKFEEPKAAPAATAAASGAASGAAEASAAASQAAQAMQAVAAAAPAAPAAKTEAAGGGAAPALYTQVCATCHATGLAGAPKFGDKAAWAPRLALGIDGLTDVAIHGKGAMPPKGGSTASDADIKAVVTYMVSAVK
jgi:cytochrome c5